MPQIFYCMTSISSTFLITFRISLNYYPCLKDIFFLIFFSPSSIFIFPASSQLLQQKRIVSSVSGYQGWWTWPGFWITCSCHGSWVNSPLECVPVGLFFHFCSFLWPRNLEQCLAHSSYAIYICQMGEQISGEVELRPWTLGHEILTLGLLHQTTEKASVGLHLTKLSVTLGNGLPAHLFTESSSCAVDPLLPW